LFKGDGFVDLKPYLDNDTVNIYTHDGIFDLDGGTRLGKFDGNGKLTLTTDGANPAKLELERTPTASIASIRATDGTYTAIQGVVYNSGDITSQVSMDGGGKNYALI